MSPRRTQIHSAYRLKKFIDPQMSKFNSEKHIEKNTAADPLRSEKEENCEEAKSLEAGAQSTKAAAAKSIKQRVTRERSKQLLFKKQEAQAISSINTLMIPEDEKLKLKIIALKIFHSVQLSPSEWHYWEKFSNSEKSFLLTGDTANTLDFTQYHKCYNQVTPQPLEQHLPAQHQNPIGWCARRRF